MQEIKCPNCGQVFQVDESGYAQIVQQVRDQEFAKELARREQEMEKRRENDLTIARMAQEKQHRAALTEKESELAEKDREIAALQSRLAGSETEKKLAVSEAVAQKEKASDDVLGKKNEELAAKDREIERLKAQLSGAQTEKALAVTQAVQAKDRELSEKATEITELKGQLTGKETERQLQEKSMREQYEEKLRLKDEQIEYYKDFKARQSRPHRQQGGFHLPGGRRGRHRVHLHHVRDEKRDGRDRHQAQERGLFQGAGQGPPGKRLRVRGAGVLA